jgi:hypothetical protein
MAIMFGHKNNYQDIATILTASRLIIFTDSLGFTHYFQLNNNRWYHSTIGHGNQTLPQFVDDVSVYIDAIKNFDKSSFYDSDFRKMVIGWFGVQTLKSNNMVRLASRELFGETFQKVVYESEKQNVKCEYTNDEIIHIFHNWYSNYKEEFRVDPDYHAVSLALSQLLHYPKEFTRAVDDKNKEINGMKK